MGPVKSFLFVIAQASWFYSFKKTIYFAINIKKINREIEVYMVNRNLRNASNKALQQDAGTGEDGNSLKMYCRLNQHKTYQQMELDTLLQQINNTSLSH